MIDCNEWRTEKRHECANMEKVKRLELWWQLYHTSLPVWDLENFRPMDFCWHECTYYNINISFRIQFDRWVCAANNQTVLRTWYLYKRSLCKCDCIHTLLLYLPLPWQPQTSQILRGLRRHSSHCVALQLRIFSTEFTASWTLKSILRLNNCGIWHRIFR